MSGEAVIAARGLSVRLGHRQVVEGADFAVAAGEIVGLIGPNGAGKTTLLKALAGLVPAQGEIEIEGRPAASLARAERARRIGYLPQEGIVAWALPVRALVALGRLPHVGPFRAFAAADHAAVERAIATLRLEPLAERPVTQLSGGERARALLARTLAGEPAVLLADEPVAGLDPAHQLSVMRELRRLVEAGTAVVVVLHDLTLAARYCDRLVLLNRGRVAASGAPLQVLAGPEASASYGIALAIGEVAGQPVVLPHARG